VSLDHGCARDVLNNALEGSFKVACITGIYQYTTKSLSMMWVASSSDE
jgi:hypothetical protein